MELFSGRLDIVINKQETKKNLASFFKFYGSNEHDFIACYEEKTKAGLPCKPHVHFLFYSDKSHDGMRKTLSGYGYKGSLGSLSKVSANPKWTVETTYSYVLKQQEILLTNLADEELNEKLELAKQKNEVIKDKMTTFNQHWEKVIVPYLIQEDIFERPHIYVAVHRYIMNWNRNNIEEAPINYPCRNTLLQLVQQFEGKYLPEDVATTRFLEDNGFSSWNIKDSLNTIKKNI